MFPFSQKCFLSPTNFSFFQQMFPFSNKCFLFSGDVEFIAGLPTYHVTAVCSLNTTVMALSRTHFDRLLVKRTADTVTRMRHIVTEQLSARTSRPHLTRQLPLFGCIIAQLNQVTNRPPKTNIGRDDGSVISGLSRTNWRAKSVLSTRSFPLAALKRQSDHWNTTDVSGGQGGFSARSSTKRPRDTTSFRYNHMVDRRPTGRTSASNRNPRAGIFVKLLQVSNPEQVVWPLHVDQEEYTYLLQLKRRLAKQMDDFFPHVPLSLGSREQSKVEQPLPRLAGQPHKQKDSATGKQASPPGAASKRKVTTFSLPGV